MALIYSDHYTATVSGSTVDIPRVKVPAGVDGASIRYRRCTITTTTGTAAGDLLYFFPMKRDDRLIELLISTPGDGGTTLTLDIGLYATAEEGGALIDQDLFFDDDLVLTTLRQRVDVMISSFIDDWDRGLSIWELANTGSASYANAQEAPAMFDIVGIIRAESATAGVEIVLEALFTSAGK